MITKDDRRKSRQAQKKFLDLWEKNDEIFKPELLRLLIVDPRFFKWNSAEKLDFLLSVLKKYAPAKTNIFNKEEKFVLKRRIFEKAFLSLFKKRSNCFGSSIYGIYFTIDDNSSVDRIKEKLIKIKNILKSLQEIKYDYSIDSKDNLFFKDPFKRNLIIFLEDNLRLNFSYLRSNQHYPGTGKRFNNLVTQVEELTLKILIQTFNFQILEEKVPYKNLLYRQDKNKRDLIIKLLEEEKIHCLKSVLDPKTECLKQENISQIMLLLETMAPTSKIWLEFMLKVKALNGDFD